MASQLATAIALPLPCSGQPTQPAPLPSSVVADTAILPEKSIIPAGMGAANDIAGPEIRTAIAKIRPIRAGRTIFMAEKVASPVDVAKLRAATS